MSSFTLQLWREWRAHRGVLLAQAVFLPLAAGLASFGLRRSVLGDPYFAAAVSAGFALVLLVSVGGELLGAERRGRGLGWLERLPDGLGGAFRAKLAFLGLALPCAMLYGSGIARTLALLRGVEVAAANHFVQGLLTVGTVVVLVLGAWTFSTSAWALRGGLAVLAAAVVLALVGLPVQRTVQAGYLPMPSEVAALGGAMIAAGLVGARLAFVNGSRLGRGTGRAALLGLLPALPIGLAALTWSTVRLEEGRRFDPGASGVHVLEPWVSADGSTALVIAQAEHPRWQSDLIPMHAVRIDLALGTEEDLGVLDFSSIHSTGAKPSELVLHVEGSEPRAFDLRTGAEQPWKAEDSVDDRWRPRGLGFLIDGGKGRKTVFRDPFRGVDFPVRVFGEVAYSGTLLVRPGRWLYSAQGTRWEWLDPETGEREPVDWTEHARPLVVLADGRVLVADPELGLRMLQPEQGLAEPLDPRGFEIESLRPNRERRRTPTWRSGEDVPGTLVVAGKGGLLVIDESTLETRRLDVGALTFVRMVDPSRAIVLELHGRDRLANLDLASGTLETLWPRRD